jgi:dipeptidase D
MSNIVNNLEPREVFKYFEEICQIPRCSGNEKDISDYLVSFAKEHNLDVIQDEALNVIIKKPGTTGYENAPIVIIQGHMDMVCEKNKGTEHDFEKDPIKLKVVEDMLYATNTTLGGDNGIAVAYGLAILASKDIPHPPLEILITTEEESGMGGAKALNAQHLNGRLLINIDSEEEGTLLVSCSGGIRTSHALKLDWEDAKEGLTAYSISIRGLKGGHSGMEIHKQRGNSNKLMGRLLNDLCTDIEFYISELNGGAKMNAIPREADAIVLVNQENLKTLEDKVNEWNKIFKSEMRTSDPNISVNITKYDKVVEKVFSRDTMNKAIASLVLIPNGVQSMSMDIEGLVESSTNLGVVSTSDNKIKFESAIRSSVKSLKYDILNQSNVVAKFVGSEFNADSDYPEWQYNPESKLRQTFQKVYKDMYGAEAHITAIHAGLECGILSEKVNDLDMISFGPNMYDVHTPDEHLSISSTKKMWDYLLAVLKEIK